jgi:hypothetical protein
MIIVLVLLFRVSEAETGVQSNATGIFVSVFV